MTNHKLSALDLYILADTLLYSLHISNWSGSATKEAREKMLDKLQEIMNDMNVEVLTDTPDVTTITADTGI